MHRLDSAQVGTQEVGQGTRLPRAQGQGIREALSVGGEVVSLSKAHSGPHDGVDVLGDHVEEVGQVGDVDIHHSVQKLGEVQLHVHRADYFLQGHASHSSQEARAPQSPLVYSCCQGVECRGLQL